MQRPFFSFLLSSTIWLIIIFIFTFFQLNKKQFLTPKITIDAEMIGEEISEKNPPQLKKQSNLKPKNDKVFDLKKSKKEINQTHNHHFANKETIKNSENSKLEVAKLVYQPLPKIPDELRRDAFLTKAVARFYILKNGNVKEVELIEMSNNPKLNFLLLKFLKKWRFEESLKESTQDIEVIFEVK